MLELILKAFGLLVLDACDFVINIHNMRHRKEHDSALVILRQAFVFFSLVFAIGWTIIHVLSWLLNNFPMLRMPFAIVLLIATLWFIVSKTYKFIMDNEPKKPTVNQTDFGFPMQDHVKKNQIPGVGILRTDDEKDKPSLFR